MNKKISILFAIFLSSTIQAESFNKDQINEFECTPAEMSKILTKEDKTRVTQTKYNDFTKPFQQAAVQEVANEITEETGVETSADEVTSEQLKEKGADYSCLNVDFSKVGENIMGGLDALQGFLTDGLADASLLIDETMADLSKGLCSRFALSAADLLAEAVDGIGKEAKKQLENKIRDDEFLRILDNKGRDYFVNDQIKEVFGDKSSMLKWRDGGIDKDNFKSKVNRMWGNELDDLYDDFYDQVDDKIDGN